MKYIIILIMFIHGAIHLMGFARGFNVAAVEGIQSYVSKTSAIFWLLAFVLLVLAGVCFWLGKDLWMLFAGIGIMLSSILIWGIWSDAKFGMIPNAIIAIAIMVSYSGWVFTQKISDETAAILSASGEPVKAIIEMEDIMGLPLPVRRWLTSSGVVGTEKVRSVWLEQDFLMKLKPDQEDWHKATAQQYIVAEKPAFIWTVEMDMSPIIKIRGRDKFMDGKGEMLMKMNSIINLGRETGAKMDEGTLQRFLGELVWLPSAVISPHISWEEIDALSAKATMTYQGTTGSGIFYFDEQGDFVRYSALRFMGNDPDAQRFEWIITVDEYAIFEGVRIPSKMKATWKLDAGNWTWCVLEIKNLVSNPVAG